MNKLNKYGCFLLLIISMTISGCGVVAPWERGNLAKPQMALDLTPLQNGMRSHIYTSREAAASSADSSTGGGCGCY